MWAYRRIRGGRVQWTPDIGSGDTDTVLARHDVDATTVSSCNASGTESVSARHSVAFTSCALSSAEIKLSVSDREALACIEIKVKVNFVIYTADRKVTTYIYAKFFLLRCVNHAALPLVRCLDSPSPEVS